MCQQIQQTNGARRKIKIKKTKKSTTTTTTARKKVKQKVEGKECIETHETKHTYEYEKCNVTMCDFVCDTEWDAERNIVAIIICDWMLNKKYEWVWFWQKRALELEQIIALSKYAMKHTVTIEYTVNKKTKYTYSRTHIHTQTRTHSLTPTDQGALAPRQRHIIRAYICTPLRHNKYYTLYMPTYTHSERTER